MIICLWTEESGGLQSMGLQRVSHDGATTEHAAYREQGVAETSL